MNMSQLGVKMKASLYERARYYVHMQQMRRLTDSLALDLREWMHLDMLQTMATLKALVPPVETIIDVGAYLGEFARLSSAVLGARKVICYEPNKEILPQLTDNMHGIPHEIRGVALADTEKSAALHLHADPSMNSLLQADAEIMREHFTHDDPAAVRSAEVEVRTLDADLSGLQALCPFFIKLDVQGMELPVLRGAQATLKKTCAVLLEYMFTSPYVGQAPFSSLVDYLQDQGFEGAAVTAMNRKPTQVVSGVDFLFLKRSM